MTIVGNRPRVIGDTIKFSGVITGANFVGATLRFKAWVGDINVPIWRVTKTLDATAPNTLDRDTGAWSAWIVPADWVDLPNKPVNVNVEVELQQADGQVDTVVPAEYFRVNAQANLPAAP